MSMKDKYMLRKTVLAAGTLLLAAVYILQVILAGRSSVRNFVIGRPCDTIEIFSEEGGSAVLRRNGESWQVDGEEADRERAALISDALLDIKTLSVISKSGGQDALERYGLTGPRKISVRVSSEGEELLYLEIGKDALGGQQNYVRFSGKGDIYLAAGALRQKCSVSAAELKALGGEVE